MADLHYLQTGLRHCYDGEGRVIDCAGTGQDAELSPGAPWPEPRFLDQDATVLDRLTGLTWLKNANPAEFPMTWDEALNQVREWNTSRLEGGSWRLPNRRELRSLISYQHRKPALPAQHPFTNVFLGWYWTSTTAAINPAFAWYVHTEGGRMFYGRKDQSYLVWPVKGPGHGLLPVTGQRRCFDSQGQTIDPTGTGQDGELQLGAPWPQPRFEPRGRIVRDRLTGLFWTASANLAGSPGTWDQAFHQIHALNQSVYGGLGTWRVPTINELESLVDAAGHTPALPPGHPFTEVESGYCSSTTSGFEPDWCMVLHMHKGAVGVGQKKSRAFFTWPVSSEPYPWSNGSCHR
jgi:hypothetical protein